MAKEEYSNYISVIYRVYKELHDREPDLNGKKDTFYQMATGRTEAEVYKIKAWSPECNEKVGYELNKYGIDNQINRNKYQSLLASRKISSLEELRKILRDEDDNKMLGIG